MPAFFCAKSAGHGLRSIGTRLPQPRKATHAAVSRNAKCPICCAVATACTHPPLTSHEVEGRHLSTLPALTRRLPIRDDGGRVTCGVSRWTCASAGAVPAAVDRDHRAGDVVG